MIEVILDSNEGNEFLREERPVFELSDLAAQNWNDYRKKAQEIYQQASEHRIIIIRNNCLEFSSNWLAVALFVESCLQQTKLEAVVFKVDDKQKALSEYSPYVALTIALKFIINLSKEDTKAIYKDIGNMGYLGLDIKHDYAANKIVLILERQGEVNHIKTQTLTDALVATALLKAMALSNFDISITAEVSITTSPNNVVIEDTIAEVIKTITPWIEK